MITPTPPSEKEIDETFEIIQDILEDLRMKNPANAQVKLGYEVSLDILDGSKTMEDIVQVKGVQASAIAMLAVDYQKGECSQKILVNVPLKGSPIKPSIS